MTRRSASGSSCSPSAVEPATSQKRIVSVLRCSRAGAGAAAGVPHATQKRNPSGLAAPHWAHTAGTATSVLAADDQHLLFQPRAADQPLADEVVDAPAQDRPQWATPALDDRRLQADGVQP